MLNWLTYDATDTNAGDLISRQAAIDELYHVDEYNGRSIEAIRNLPSAQQWIPVSERLPEDGIEVVTVDKDGDYEINHIIDKEDGEWYWRGTIAWMPLPKPWKGEV